MVTQDQTSEKQGDDEDEDDDNNTWVMVLSITAVVCLGTPYPTDLAL